MNPRLFFIAACSVLTLSVAVSADDESPQAALESFHAALHNGKAKVAIEFISSNSIANHEQLRRWSLELSRDQLEALDILDVANVLSYRLAFSRNKLKQSSGRLLLQESLSQPSTQKFFTSMRLSEFDIHGDIAVATDGSLQLCKEKSGWKIDLEHFGTLVEARYRRSWKESGLTKIERGMQLLEGQVGRGNVPEEIKDGPRE